MVPVIAAPILLFAAAVQSDLRSRLVPITGPIRNAGVYHLATGTWTRHASAAAVIGADTIYDNTCGTAYFTPLRQNERLSHRSCVPSPTHPVVATVVPAATGNDEAPGCQTSYVVDGFQFGYCSAVLGTVDWEFSFQSLYTLCANGPMTPTSTFTVSGMPGGQPPGNPVCWTIDIDLNASSLQFTLLADGNGTFNGPATIDQFGWSWMPTSNVGVVSLTGPVTAGNYTWLGGATTGVLSPCKGTDGTIWDSPINLSETGTGMVSNDFFRLDGATAAPSGPGCYFLGGNLHADHWLELYSNAGCVPVTPGTPMCEPGAAGVMSCVCGNPAGAGVGCANTGSSGGDLNSAGTASLASDSIDPGSVTLTGSSMLSGAACIHLQGNALVGAGAPFGAGIRCTGGALKRLYIKSIAAGVSTVPQPADQSISNRSAILGDVISAASTRWYQTYYRDPTLVNPGGACPAVATYNVTSGQQILWGP